MPLAAGVLTVAGVLVPVPDGLAAGEGGFAAVGAPLELGTLAGVAGAVAWPGSGSVAAAPPGAAPSPTAADRPGSGDVPPVRPPDAEPAEPSTPPTSGNGPRMLSRRATRPAGKPTGATGTGGTGTATGRGGVGTGTGVSAS